MDFDALARSLEDLRNRHRVPGLQCVVHQGGEQHGLRLGRTAPSGPDVRPDHRFPLGSITKAFTAAVVLILVADGDLDLDDPVEEIVPELVGDEVGLVTPRQLLSHTSGLPSGIDDAPHDRPRGGYVVDQCLGGGLVHPAGSVFSYSNLGYVLAGHLVERVTGMSWQQAVDSVLLAGLGARASHVVDAAGDHHVPGHAVPPGTGPPRTVPQTLPAPAAPAGSLALSAHDLAAFGALQLPDAAGSASGGLFEPGDLHPMRHDQTGDGPAGPWGMADGWGLGLALFAGGRHQWWGHDGTADGTSCHLRVCPDTGTVLALTANATTGLALWDDLVDLLPSLGVDVASRSYSRLPVDSPTIDAPDECLGRYANGATTYEVVRGPHGALSLHQEGIHYADLDVRHGLGFLLRERIGARATFVGRFVRPGGAGPVSGLQITGRMARKVIGSATPGRARRDTRGALT
ncbi:hypothetical protein C1701_17145 [Actinoalloteichus sp. AHMU CJ021]|uniref:serine hydrolase domain-containing protein n=1 Tax=Actinoalloteichus sp. AHMU CJ021 TaxID=2072503 RepID=UPI000CA07B88|nr:hypothetical protein C1701_17145 [Actinoalloteichus sp. AHMU CJ021]